MHVLESSLWLQQWEDWTVGVEWSKVPSVETFALTRTIKKKGWTKVGEMTLEGKSGG